MTLENIILNCTDKEDAEEKIFVVFAEKIGEKFAINSKAEIAEFSAENIDAQIDSFIKNQESKLSYFMELIVLQDLYNALSQVDNYKNNQAHLITRIIQYADKEN